jgi:hypothetical protein
MTTTFFWHETRSLVLILSDRRTLADYIAQHTALPPADEWERVLPLPQSTPLYRAQAALIHEGAEPVLVFKAPEQPVEAMHWYGGLVHLIATLRRAIATYEKYVQTA